jgi:hypothetical protein
VFIFILACTDKDVTIHSIDKIPELYRQINSKIKGYWTNLKIVGWLIDAIYYILILHFRKMTMLPSVTWDYAIFMEMYYCL